LFEPEVWGGVLSPYPLSLPLSPHVRGGEKGGEGDWGERGRDRNGEGRGGGTEV